MRRLNIGAKIGLSVGVFILAYVLSAALTLVQNRAARGSLRFTSEALFPAAQRSQEAEASFQRMVKGFGDAVIMQDASGLDRAADEGRQAAAALNTTAKIPGLSANHAEEARRAASEINQVLTDARTIYKAALSGGLNSTTQDQMRALAGRINSVKANLAKVKSDLALDLHGQLNTLETRSARQDFIALSVFVFGLSGAGLISWFIIRSITNPLAKALHLVNGVAKGDLTHDLEVTSGDEIGQMLTALNAMIESMRTALQEVSDSANGLTVASEQVASGCSALAAGAHESTASLEETSASLEEITSMVKQNSENAKHASSFSTAACDNAVNGGSVVQSAITAMAEINTSSRKISDIISKIDEIAFQTNLLAVNAAIEAARAGDEGRGFAVVAQEVRALAQRSAVAAKEIKTLITDSVQKVEHGTEFVNHSGRTLQEIVASIKRAADAVGEISAASGEQATGVEQVNIAITRMNKVTQSSSEQTEVLSKTAQNVSQQAAELRHMLARFILPENGTSTQNAASVNAERPTTGRRVKADQSDSASRNGLRALARQVERNQVVAQTEEESFVEFGENEG